MPMLTVNGGTPAAAIDAPNEERRRCTMGAAWVTSQPTKTTRNSSPPNRQTRSLVRTAVAVTVEKWRRAASPEACP
jgi:hypothetical protein